MAAYNKRIRGDSNVANEEWSHNRITIVAGGAGILLAGFVCMLILAAIAWMMLKESTFLALLINALAVLLFLGAAITGGLFVARQLSETLRVWEVNKLLGRTVIAGEVVTHYNEDGNEWLHLSAAHEQAKLAQLPPPREMNTNEATILELYDRGLSLRAIEKSLKDAGVTYYQIQKVTSAHRGNGKGSPSPD